MDPMENILLHNPGLLAMGSLLLGAMLVCGLLALLMGRAGVSLRPLVFFAVFFAIVVLPQVLGHLAMAVKPGPVAAAAPLPVGQPRFDAVFDGAQLRDPTQVFGADHAQGRREDQRALYASRMPGLRAADALQWPGGDGVSALLFESEAQANAGLLAYLSLFSVAPTLDRGGSELRGQRQLGGGFVHLWRSGPVLLVVTALSEPALDARAAAVPVLLPAATAASPAASAAEPLVPALQPLLRLFRAHVALQVVGVLLAVAVAVGWFFWGSAWASSAPPAAGALQLPAVKLRARLLALQQTQLPMDVDTDPGGRIVVTWRYGDARWLDAAGLNQTRRTHRLLLRLDEANRCVRVTEQWSEWDAGAGAAGARLRWQTAIGIRFFQVEHGHVVGLQLGPDGRPTGDLSHAWQFNLQELKAPLITAVTGAGWTWRPVLLDLPALLSRGQP